MAATRPHYPGNADASADVDEELVEESPSIDMVPAFSFIDPFGYKGVTLESPKP